MEPGETAGVAVWYVAASVDDEPRRWVLRITMTSPVHRDGRHEVYARDIDEACQSLRTWFFDLVGAAGGGG